MEREKIIKALECCISGYCIDQKCPLFNWDDEDDISKCTSKLSKNALALIKELTEENKKLTSIGISKDIIIEGINDVIVKLNEENERVKSEVSVKKKLLDKCVDLEDRVRDDTVKKMQERLNSVRGYDDEFEYNSWWGERINQIAKEMLEERE